MSTTNNHTPTFKDWLSVMRHMAIEEYNMPSEAVYAISEAEVETLFLHGCSPAEALDSLNYA